MGRSRMAYLLIGYILLSLSRGFQRRVSLAKLGSSRNTVLCDGRELGSYETFLSRTVDSDERYIALSHGTVFLLSVAFDETLLQEACAVQMERHPLLRSHVHETPSGDRVWQTCNTSTTLLARITVVSVQVDTEAEFENTWMRAFAASLNNATFPANGPLWRLTQVSLREERSAWVFCSNHAIGDQRSFNILVEEMLQYLQTGGTEPPCQIAPSIEAAVGRGPASIRTLLWAGYQLYNMLARPAVLPVHLQRNDMRLPMQDPSARRTFIKHFRLSVDATRRLSALAREHRTSSARVTVTHVLSAAMICVSDLVLRGDVTGASGVSGVSGVPGGTPPRLTQRILLAVDLRNFAHNSAGEDFTRGTVACASGAVDYLLTPSQALTRHSREWAQFVVGPPPSLTDLSPRPRELSEELREELWLLAAECCKRSESLLHTCRFVPESVRLFDIGMKLQRAGVADIFRATDMDAHSLNTLGRGYTCGVSNMGIMRTAQVKNIPPPTSAHRPPVKNPPLSAEQGNARVKEAYFATSHARNGVLFQLSCMTVDEALCGCLQFTSPITTEEEAETFLVLLEKLLNNL